jgi:hypothetical protein
MGRRTEILRRYSIEVLDVLILDSFKELVVRGGVTHLFESLSVSYFLFKEFRSLNPAYERNPRAGKVTKSRFV